MWQIKQWYSSWDNWESSPEGGGVKALSKGQLSPVISRLQCLISEFQIQIKMLGWWDSFTTRKFFICARSRWYTVTHQRDKFTSDHQWARTYTRALESHIFDWHNRKKTVPTWSTHGWMSCHSNLVKNVLSNRRRGTINAIQWLAILNPRLFNHILSLASVAT